MNKITLSVSLLILTASWAGCSSVTPRFYVADKERVDQNIPGLPLDQQPGIKTRKVLVWEFEKKPKQEVFADELDQQKGVSVTSDGADLLPGTEYVVEKGDTLQKISKKFYGNYSGWLKIYKHNQDVIYDPDHVVPGVILKIPGE